MLALQRERCVQNERGELDVDYVTEADREMARRHGSWDSPVVRRGQ